MEFAKKLGHSVENLKTMRAPNTINPFAKYRIDIQKLEFIELAEPRKGDAIVNFNSFFLVILMPTSSLDDWLEYYADKVVIK